MRSPRISSTCPWCKRLRVATRRGRSSRRPSGSIMTLPPQKCGNITSSSTTRGNATSIGHGNIVNGVVNQWLTTMQSFDAAGNLVDATDPRGVRKDISYADGASMALPVSITHHTAVNSTCPGTGCLTEQFTYDYNILKPLTYTDLNGNKTSLTYYPDPLDRLLNVTRPDTGQTSFTYSDAPGTCATGNQSTSCPSVQTKQDLTSAGDKIKTQTDYDGLGRKALTWYLAPEGEIDTQYTYDAKGRLYTVSNPGNLSQLTTYSYDILNRPLTITAQDGSVTSYMYYGDTSTLANTKLEIEPPWNSNTGNGNNRLYFTDALGRLVQVNENQSSWQSGTYGHSGPSTPTYTTTYTYDVLDDLTGVTQSAQSRSFTYDSLKRLVQATNPENGTITYQYDNSGNLQTRIDADDSITTSSFDGLNRVTSKSYTPGSGVAATSSVGYTYDGASGCNQLGRLASATSGNQVNNYPCYYWTGMPTSSSQVTGGATYSMSYGYNLAGKPTSFTFPSLRQQTINYDSAGRVSGVTGANGTPSYASLTSSDAYFPNGGIRDLRLGPNALVQQYCQNNRLQTVGVRQAPLGGGTTGACANSGTGSSGDPLNLATTYGVAGAHNGNMTAETIQTASSGAWLNVTQNFTYDAYDRLLTASEGSNWSQNYGYDAYGNRWVSSGYLPNFNLPNPKSTPTASTDFNASNQLAATMAAGGTNTYDPGGSGNLIGTNGSTFSYDAENRQVAANVYNSASSSLASRTGNVRSA